MCIIEYSSLCSQTIKYNMSKSKVIRAHGTMLIQKIGPPYSTIHIVDNLKEPLGPVSLENGGGRGTRTGAANAWHTAYYIINLTTRNED